ncbi:MAG: isoaspartyl peptidase/L-asparaginase [Pseudomonadota bacterium]
MLRAIVCAFSVFATFCLATGASAEDRAPAAPVLVVHGGAGAMAPGRYTAAEELAYRDALTAALNAGGAILEDGGSALDAVETAIRLLEDSPLFNAGRGAVLTREGDAELDASIMDGANANAGAVAGVTSVKNPITLARRVMENSEHVMFARDGAEKFAKAQRLEREKASYFKTDARKRDYEAARKKEKDVEKQGAHGSPPEKFGTVGAVALDADGNLAAGTSTGGMLMKRFGRVGDSPVVGAGTFADNRSCAVSSTGHGEFFIRLTVARDICAQMEYGGRTLKEAARDVIHNRLEGLGGSGGIIAVDPSGETALTFNTAGMFRGVKRAGAAPEVAIYGERLVD